jgi:mannose-6-phosphate isomerase-like protein (cupin superfamily)
MKTKDYFAYARDMDLVVHKNGGRHSTLIVTKEDMDADGFILGSHSMDPGGGAPVHTHDKESEAMYFYAGTGVATIDGREYAITPESVMLAKPGVPHSIRNTGTEPLKFVFVYCPPLPEHVSRREYFARAKDKLPGPAEG